MSRGELTDYKHDLFRIKDWAEVLKPINPLLSEQLNDLYGLLMDYDSYLSGDTSDTTIESSWQTYRSKWIGIISPELESTMMDICMAELSKMLKGHPTVR